VAFLLLWQNNWKKHQPHEGPGGVAGAVGGYISRGFTCGGAGERGRGQDEKQQN